MGILPLGSLGLEAGTQKTTPPPVPRSITLTEKWAIGMLVGIALFIHSLRGGLSEVTQIKEAGRDGPSRELLIDLLFFARHLDDFCGDAVSIHQGREIVRLERVLMSRFLPGCTQGNIHPTVVGQDEGVEFF